MVQPSSKSYGIPADNLSYVDVVLDFVKKTHSCWLVNFSHNRSGFPWFYL